MKNMIKTTRLTVLILIITAAAVSGCRTLTPVDRNRVIFPENAFYQKDDTSDHRLVFAINSQRMGSRLEIKKFGIYDNGGPTLDIGGGLSSILYLNDAGHRTYSDLEHVLRIHGYGSVNEFIDDYAQRPPLIPGSRYSVLPHSLGREIFRIAQKAAYWDEWLFREPPSRTLP